MHDHQTVYTLRSPTTACNPTTGVTLEDYLPAGLEFLGCGGTADHTTDAPTNPGSREEYHGSGPITVPALARLHRAADRGRRRHVDPDGPWPAAQRRLHPRRPGRVGTLRRPRRRTFTLRAAVPMRANTLTFTGAPADACVTGQAANLDNNSARR